VLPFFTSLGAKPSLIVIFGLLIEVDLIFFELAFESKVGEYIGSFFPNKGDCLLEAPVLLAHEVGDN